MEKRKIIFDLKELNNPSIQQLNSYSFSNDERKILFSQNDEQIYRHSSKGEYYSYDIETKKLTRIFPQGK